MATVAELSKVVRTLPNLVSTLGNKKYLCTTMTKLMYCIFTSEIR